MRKENKVKQQINFGGHVMLQEEFVLYPCRSKSSLDAIYLDVINKCTQYKTSHSYPLFNIYLRVNLVYEVCIFISPKRVEFVVIIYLQMSLFKFVLVYAFKKYLMINYSNIFSKNCFGF